MERREEREGEAKKGDEGERGRDMAKTRKQKHGDEGERRRIEKDREERREKRAASRESREKRASETSETSETSYLLEVESELGDATDAHRLLRLHLVVLLQPQTQTHRSNPVSSLPTLASDQHMLHSVLTSINTFWKHGTHRGHFAPDIGGRDVTLVPAARSQHLCQRETVAGHALA
eukprot:1917067-Rhodomonas_salina.1